MENQVIIVQLILILGFSFLSQWVAWRAGIPAVIFFLGSGLLIGPILGWISVDTLFHQLLFPFVSLCVAIILFEGGLTLNLKKITDLKVIIFRLCSLGALSTWILVAFLAYHTLGFTPGMSLLIGALLIVTGPTVIAPTVRQFHLNHTISASLKWEGVITDPIGAILSVLILQMILHKSGEATTLVLVKGIFYTFLVGTAIGILFGGLFLFLKKKELIPFHLEVPLIFVLVIFSWFFSNFFAHEAGLLAVTVMGLVLANQSHVDIQRLSDFKADLQMILIPVLFTTLAARVDFKKLYLFEPSIWMFLFGLIFFARPLSVLIATFRSGLDFRDILFMAFFAPRGIVAIAVASIYALELQSIHHPNANLFLSVMIMTVLVTVIVYGLIAMLLVRIFNITVKEPDGILIYSADLIGRWIAAALEKAGVDVKLVDTDEEDIAIARQEGLDAQHISIFSETIVEDLELDNYGSFVALSDCDKTNSLVCLYFRDFFGEGKVYQLSPSRFQNQDSVYGQIPGNLFVNKDLHHSRLLSFYFRGNSFYFKKTQEEKPENSIACFQICEGKKLLVLTENITRCKQEQGLEIGIDLTT